MNLIFLNSEAMKKKNLFLIALIILPFVLVKAQDPGSTDPKAAKVQVLSIQGDTAYTIVLDKENQIEVPGLPTEYSIASYKNVDYLKINPLQLDLSGTHTDIYVSNTHQGVIIISSAEANDALKDFSHTLELNPTYYEKLTRQDTLVISSSIAGSPAFDFTKASMINHDYKNAFNYTIDPRTGISWSKGTHKDFIQDDILGKAVYDLIIVRPKK
jgi:hypothetical protein